MTTTLFASPTAMRWAPWFGLFGGLMAWMLHLAIGFALVYDSCRTGFSQLRLWLVLITLLLALIALAATLVGYRLWHHTQTDQEEAGGAAGVQPFMGFVGAALSGLSLFIIVLTAIPVIWLMPCI